MDGFNRQVMQQSTSSQPGGVACRQSNERVVIDRLQISLYIE